MSTEAMALDMRVNGQVHTGVAQTRTLLSDFLRHGVGFTGVHVGCEHGVCGACTVLLDGAPVRSCLMSLSRSATPRSPPSKRWRAGTY